MTPRELYWQLEGEQWRYERNTLLIVGAQVGKTPDELMGKVVDVNENADIPL